MRTNFRQWKSITIIIHILYIEYEINFKNEITTKIGTFCNKLFHNLNLFLTFITRNLFQLSVCMFLFYLVKWQYLLIVSFIACQMKELYWFLCCFQHEFLFFFGNLLSVSVHLQHTIDSITGMRDISMAEISWTLWKSISWK